jgi:F0F1-type ATP synthase assembly protein I
MSQSNPPSQAPDGKQTVNNVGMFLSVGAEVGCATLIIVIASLVIGIGLDKFLGTKPVFIILFTLGSAPLAIYATYKLALRTVKGAIPQQPEAKQVKPVEEEEKSE